MLKNLQNYNIILASKSPRRRELMQMLHIPFHSVVITGLSEEYPSDMDVMAVPEYLSNLKADAYLNRCQPQDLIITADTVVILDNKVYGKPHSREEAVRMLREFSEKTHLVLTGVCAASHLHRKSFTCTTEVKFSHISDDEIRYYVDTFNPVDKAGAYGIQEWIGGIAVEWINGSFYNVMGLPIHRLYKTLKDFPRLT